MGTYAYMYTDIIYVQCLSVCLSVGRSAWLYVCVCVCVCACVYIGTLAAKA